MDWGLKLENIFLKHSKNAALIHLEHWLSEKKSLGLKRKSAHAHYITYQRFSLLYKNIICTKNKTDIGLGIQANISKSNADHWRSYIYILASLQIIFYFE